MTVVEFLLARLDEDEDAISQMVRDGEGGLWGWRRYEAEREAKLRIVKVLQELMAGHWSHSQHVYALTLTCAELAMAYADHPDYRQSWRTDTFAEEEGT
jgi:hypothetical protein